RTVNALQALDIDPQVKPVDPDFLPLYYSCERDNRRLKLRHQAQRGDHFALTTCPGCDTAYKFYLGRQTLAVAEITGTNRWSPNLCLPIFINDLVSGMVVGKSSALYGLVFNAVLREVLGKQPVPLYVPTNLTLPANQPDSLLYRYFQGMKL
ncbi:MAG: hypothetical protein HYR94_25045, partial [Chloroflexi bacterium]|nr:hypothetical protein [Chloroflexota bacterium]